MDASVSGAESSAVECFVCHNDFQTTAALKSHLEVVHFDSMSTKEMEMYKRFMTTGLLPQVTPAEEPMGMVLQLFCLVVTVNR